MSKVVNFKDLTYFLLGIKKKRKGGGDNVPILRRQHSIGSGLLTDVSFVTCSHINVQQLFFLRKQELPDDEFK